MPNTLWSTDWLNEYPQAAYGAYRPQTGSWNFLNYWKGQQSNVYDDWWTKLGSMARTGEAPSVNYTDFLSSYPFMQQWAGMSPGERGEQPQRFAPRVRWNL